MRSHCATFFPHSCIILRHFISVYCTSWINKFFAVIAYFPPQACTPFSPYNVMYSGWMGDDDSSFLGLRACAHKVDDFFSCFSFVEVG